jgi:hypothetical protein
MTKPAFPVFVFARRRDIEIETGLTLAGNLVVDIPKGRIGPHHEQGIQKIMDRLYAEVRSGRMGDDAVINGWPGGVKPANAVDTRDGARMAAWAKGCVTIAVRIDDRDDGMVRIDSDIARQLGLMQGALRR